MSIDEVKMTPEEEALEELVALNEEVLSEARLAPSSRRPT